MQYRRKNGLCFKCGENWGHNHTCPAQIPLHVIEEVWDALQPEEARSEPSEDETEDYDVLMAVSSNAQSDLSKRKTMRLHGIVQGVKVVILVDSGSIGTFISENLANHLSDRLAPCSASQFTTADDSPMTCNVEVKNLQWISQGHIFSSDAKVLPLKCFDMIVGEDWLEACSPMWIHWGKKIMKLTYEGKRITLHGFKPKTSKCSTISATKLKGLLKKKAISHCIQLWPQVIDNEAETGTLTDQTIHSIAEPEIVSEVKQLIQEYSHLFKEPDSLPPPRYCDHQIALIPGALPVNVRAYRYAPSQKNEIEKQLADMLKNGIIRPSSSPFASPVLLVRKKDGSWRFCVDYRHLNNITIKNKHPMPVVE